MVNGEVEVVSYVHPDDGELAYCLRYRCDLSTSTLLGLLELAKAEILERRREE